MSAPSPRSSPILPTSATPAGSDMPSTPKTPHNPRPAPIARKPMFEDISHKEFLDFQSAATATEYDDCDPDTYYSIRAPSVWMIRCTILLLIIIYAGWAVWLYYYTKTVVWPLPRGQLNGTDGLLHRLTIVTRFSIALLGLVSLLVPLVLFMRTRVPGRIRSLPVFTGWIAFCFVMLVIPVAIYYVFLCSMQGVAYAEHCSAGEEITAHFVGSSSGLSGNSTTATLFRTNDPKTPIAKLSLSRTGESDAVFSFMEGETDYFRVSYFISEDQESMTARAYSSPVDPGSITAAGTLGYISISPLNDTLRSVGEVQERPVNFRLVDNPHMLANGTVDGLGTIGKDVVLRSLATDPWNCSKLKLCAKSIDDPAMRAKVLISMGWALYKHAEYAFSC